MGAEGRGGGKVPAIGDQRVERRVGGDVGGVAVHAGSRGTERQGRGGDGAAKRGDGKGGAGT